MEVAEKLLRKHLHSEEQYSLNILCSLMDTFHVIIFIYTLSSIHIHCHVVYWHVKTFSASLNIVQSNIRSDIQDYICN